MSERQPYRRTPRCVHCGAQEANHARQEDGRMLCVGSSCTIERKTFGSMNLPEGKTCGDCEHLKRPCAPIYGRIAEDESCDWYPSRFVPIQRRAPIA